MNYAFGVVIPMFSGCLIFFSLSILNIRTLLPKSFQILRGIGYLFFALALFFFVSLHYAFVVMNIVITFVTFFLLYAGIKSFLSGNKAALFFLIAQLSFIVLALRFSLMSDGYLGYTEFSRNGISIGFLIEMILFAFALAYRIKTLQKDKLNIINKYVKELDEKVSERTKELEESKKALEILAATDALTGLYNRRALYELSTKLLNLAHRENIPFSIIIFDIDTFKKINDHYGHAIGDKVIIAFSNILLNTRKSDVAARIGGEEFLILLPNTNLNEAYKIAEQIRKKAENISIPLPENKSFNFSVSGGIDLLQDSDQHITSLLPRADSALYQSKQTGRNKNTLYTPNKRRVIKKSS